jgi:phosphohistidine swiveling domain-containing protein
MKAILYSILASLLMIPIIGLVIFSFNSIESNIDTNIRANELNYFSSSIENDMERFLRIAGRRAVISAVSEIVTQGYPLADAQSNLTEMIESGTLDGKVAPLVENNNLNSWQINITQIANQSGFNVSLQNMSIEITQNDSFNVLFTARVVLDISDPNMRMGVRKNLTVNAISSIDGIEDPLFPLQTYGRIIRTIRSYNVSNLTKSIVQGSLASGSVSGNATLSQVSPNSQKIFVTANMSQGIATLNQFGGIVSASAFVPTGLAVPYIAGATNATSLIAEGQRVYLDLQTKKVWDLINLTTFVINKNYKPSANGPSFLDRLEGKLNLSSRYRYGLETIVDVKNELEAENLYPLIYAQATCVDYLYWNKTNGDPVRNGNYDSIFTWLRIDNSSKISYGVSELA